MSDSQLAVEMQGIVKRFPGVLANDHVDFEVRTGEVHALLGENGAGKTTLMNVLAGLYRPEAGEIVVGGHRQEFHSPRDAIRSGIGMVHQHFMLVPALTVAENLALGTNRPRFLLRRPALESEVKSISERFGMPVDPAARIWQLSVGEQQRVEVLRMLYYGAKILILDEPTAVLTPQEVSELFRTLREMVKAGHTIVFISHKLGEVLAVADRITVLRKGKKEATVNARETTKEDLARMMVGREVLFRLEKQPIEPGETVLCIENVYAMNDRGRPALRSVSFEVRQNEILGIAGVAGNGQSELAQAIAGLRPVTQGRVYVCGQQVENRLASAGIRAGLAHIPEDRTGLGSVPSMSISENIALKTYNKPPIARGWLIDLGVMHRQAQSRVREYDVVTPTIFTQARLLSGGNLQKMILARELPLGGQALLAVHPTRGLDVGATEAVHRRLLEQRERGAGILLISEDLDELISLSDRVIVMYEGQIMGEVNDGNLTLIGQMMAGVGSKTIEVRKEE